MGISRLLNIFEVGAKSELGPRGAGGLSAYTHRDSILTPGLGDPNSFFADPDVDADQDPALQNCGVPFKLCKKLSNEEFVADRNEKRHLCYCSHF